MELYSSRPDQHAELVDLLGGVWPIPRSSFVNVLVWTRLRHTLCLTYTRCGGIANATSQIQVHIERHIARGAVARSIVEKVTNVLNNQIDGDCKAKHVEIRDIFLKALR